MYNVSRLILSAVVLFPLFAHCGDTMTATASGDVKLNAKPLVRSSTVFPGDELETTADSAVVLQGKQFSLQVGPTATSVVEERAVRLETGTVQAKGLATIRAGVVTAFGDTSDATFNVSHSSEKVSVKVTAGVVVVRHLSERVVIAKGQSRTFDDNGTSSTAPHHDRKWAAAAIGAASGAASGAIVASHLKNNGPCEISSRTATKEAQCY